MTGARWYSGVSQRRDVGGQTVPFRFSGYAGMDIGRDNRLPVDRDYADRSPFAFTGTIRRVVFDINPILTEEDPPPSTSTRSTPPWRTA